MLEKIGKGVKSVVFAIMRKLYNSYFLYCHFTKTIWYIIYIALGIPRRHDVSHIMNGWLGAGDIQNKGIILIGVAAIFWSIWLCRNDIVFNKQSWTTVVQALFRGTY